MLNQTSKDFRKLFLLEFTKQLINNSETAEALSIKRMLREKIKENIEKKENERRLSEMVEKKEIIPELKEITKRNIREEVKRQIPDELRIRDFPFPATVQDVRPQPSREQINLGKINPLINDPTVISIECSGPNKVLKVRRTRGETRITNIHLSEEEIGQLIQDISGKAKIPVERGTLKAAIGNLLISAIVSEVVGSKFIITKISQGNYY